MIKHHIEWMYFIYNLIELIQWTAGLRGLLCLFLLSSLALIRLVEQPIRVIPLSVVFCHRFSLLRRLKSRT